MSFDVQSYQEARMSSRKALRSNASWAGVREGFLDCKGGGGECRAGSLFGLAEQREFHG